MPGTTAMSDYKNAPPDILDQDNSLLVRFHGRMDGLHTGAFSEAVLSRIRAAAGPVVFDLAEVGFLSSVFLSLCITAAKTLGPERLQLVNVSPELRKVLKIAGLDAGLVTLTPH